jgi:hypothetical protein
MGLTSTTEYRTCYITTTVHQTLIGMQLTKGAAAAVAESYCIEEWPISGASVTNIHSNVLFKVSRTAGFALLGKRELWDRGVRDIAGSLSAPEFPCAVWCPLAR